MEEKKRLEEYTPKFLPYKLIAQEGNRFVAKNTATFSYVFLDAQEKQLLEWMDGRTKVKEILRKQFNRTGQLSFKKLFDLLTKMHEGGFLIPETASDYFPEPSRKRRFPLSFIIPLPFLKSLYPLLTKASALFFYPAFSCALLVAVVLLAIFAPIPHEVNIFSVQGQYFMGIAFILVLIVILESFRNLVRTGLLRRCRCDPLRFGLRLVGLIPLIYVDGRDIVTARRVHQAAYYLGSLGSVALVALLFQIAQIVISSEKPLIINGLFVSLSWLFINLCPFLPTDMFRLLETFFPSTQLMLHGHSYLRKKFFQRMFSKGEVGEEEKFFILLGVLSSMWIYAGILLYLSWPAFQLIELVTDFQEASAANKAAIGFLLACLALPPLFFGGSLIVGVFSNLGYALSSQKAKGTKAKESWKPTIEQITTFLSKIPLFYDLSEKELKDLSHSIQPLTFKKGQNVITQGERGDAFYILYDGEVDVIFEAPSGVETHLAKLTSGDSFGEIALIEEVSRTATVRARTKAFVLSLSKEAFDHYLASTPEKKESLTLLIRLFAQLHKMPMFSDLGQEQMAKLIRRLKRRKVYADEVVIKEGEAGDNFYIVADGTFSVWSKGAKKADLKKGDSFGEIALLKKIPRTATVKAETGGVLYTLSSEDFFDLLRDNFHAGIFVEEQAEKRLKEIRK